MNDAAAASRAGRPGAWRLVVVDDHPLFREAIKLIVSEEGGMEVVGEAKNGREAIELCRRLRPDLVVMDVAMPGMDGLEATRAIKREFPGVIVLMMTGYEDPNYLEEAIAGGAAGYVLKHESNERIAGAIRGALSGEAHLNQELAMRVLRRLLEGAAAQPKEEEEQQEEAAVPASPGRRRPGGGGGRSPGPSLLDALTKREVEVMRLLALGKDNPEIARSLFVSVSTVKKHVQHATNKLGASDRTQAAIRAIQLGVFSDEHE